MVASSEEVDVFGEPYQRMKAVERAWRHIDHYSNPGPIQFFDVGKDDIAICLKSKYG